MHADEIDGVGSQEQQLRHDRVVIVHGGDMAIVAGFGFGTPHGVREMRRESLAGKADGRDRRLLNVDAFAIDVGG